jgi:hypothetical protein
MAEGSRVVDLRRARKKLREKSGVRAERARRREAEGEERQGLRVVSGIPKGHFAK